MRYVVFVFIVLCSNFLFANVNIEIVINPIDQLYAKLGVKDSVLNKRVADSKKESDCNDNFVLQEEETKNNYQYNAKEFIETENYYEVSRQNVDIKMKAGQYIVLKPNTHIKRGSLYLGKIEPCTTCDFNFSFPKYFTPNSDGYHDYWNIEWLANAKNFTKVSIYDRYGKLLKVLTHPNSFWNGVYNSRQMSSSDYWFVLEYIDCNGFKKVYKSHFSLKR